MKLNGNIKIFIRYFLGPLLFIWLSWSIYRQIQNQPNLETAWLEIKSSLNGPKIFNLVAVVLLMLANWSIEAFKWRISVKPIQHVSFLVAFKAVLSGVSFSVSTPNRMGEYLGRVLYMEEGKRLKSISTTILGSISQLIVTLFMGVIALYFLRSAIVQQHLVSGIWLQVISYGTLAVLVVLTLLYFKLSWISTLLHRIPKAKRFLYLTEALEDFNATMLLKLLSLSVLRFFVFITQYYLLFDVFGVDISMGQSFVAVSGAFLVLAIIPSFAIADLGLRGEVSLKLIGLFSANSLGILLSTISIWFINLIVPAVIGSLLILSIRKLFNEK